MILNIRVLGIGLVVAGLCWTGALGAAEPAPAVTSKIILKTTRSWDGTPIVYPQGTAEVTGIIVTVAPGAQTGWHAHPVPSFEGEGLGHDADRQNAAVPGAFGDDRRGTRSGAATHAGGDEDHMGPFEVPVDFVGRLLGGIHADLGMGPGTQPLGDGLAQLDPAIGLGERQMLRVCVGDNKFDAFETGIDHVVDRIPAGSADSENNDPRLEIRGLRTHQRERHFYSDLIRPCPCRPMRNPAVSHWL